MAGRILSGSALPPQLCIALLALLLLTSVPAMLWLNVNNAPEAYLPQSAPAVVFDKRLRQQFPSDKVLIALFQGDIYSERFLTGLAEATRRMQQNPYVERALSVFTMDHVSGTADGFVVETLLDADMIGTQTPRQLRARILNDRFAPGMLVARDGSALALILRPVDLQQSQQRLALEGALQQVVKETGIDQELSAVAGNIALYAAQYRSMIRDSLIFVPVTFVLGMMLFWLMFRRVMAVVAGILAMGAVTASTVAIIVLSGQPYTLITAMIPSLMAALTAALLVHLYNGFVLAAQRGYRGEARVAWACRNIERPARFTALTTAAGLASLSLSPIPPIHTFGLSAAAGVLLIYVVCVVLLPPVFARWDTKPWRLEDTALIRVNRFIKIMSGLGIRYAGLVVVLTAALLLWALPNLVKVTAETNMLKFFGTEHPITQATQIVEDKLSGVTSLEVVFKGNGRDVLKDPERLHQLKALQRQIEALPEVDRTFSMMGIIEEMNWAFHGEDAHYRRIPDSRALISQYLLIYDGRDLYDLVDREFQQTRLQMSVNVHSANNISALIEKLRGILRGATLDERQLEWRIAGFGRLFADLEDLLIEGQIRSLLGALGLIFGLLFIMWRSLPAAGLCMLPNASPLLVMFAVMGAFGIWLDMATAMIASVAVGIAVDDTIHLFHVYRSRLQAGCSPVWALARAYRQAGRAISVTTLILCAQFAILTLSQFRPTMEFGLLTTFGLVAALLFDLLLLPAILVLLVRWRAGSRIVSTQGTNP